MKDYLGAKDFKFLTDTLVDTLKQFELPSNLRIMENRLIDRVSMINLSPIGRPLKENQDIQLNRKMLAELAARDFEAFTAVYNSVK
jgi:hypothetical protein